MTDSGATVRICRAIEALGEQLTALEAAGRGVPAVERNAFRLRGTLNALEIQFSDLETIVSASPAPNSHVARRT